MKSVITILVIASFSLILNSCYKEEELIQPAGKIQYSVTKDYEFDIEFRSNCYYNKKEQLVKIENVLPNSENTFFLYEYDKDGHLTKETLLEPNGRETWSKYEYNEAGQRVKEYTSNGAENTYNYDELGRLSNIHYNLNYTLEDVYYLYDSTYSDRVKYEKKFEGESLMYYNLEYKYNQDGLLIEKDFIDGDYFRYNDGPWEQYEYNANGQKTRYIEYNREWNSQDQYLVIQKVDYYYK